ncbi:MAG: hypothetical protein OXN90_10600 [Gemmatimonadota bacterium]|nr:hypothetical protein [Gemmatimonadota bacterium]
MACRFTFLLILLLSPVEVLAQWYMSYGQDPITGKDIYAARLDNMKIVTHGEEVAKAQMSVMYSCISQVPNSIGFGMYLDTTPKFSPPGKKVVGVVYSHPAKITLYKEGDTKFKSIRTEITQSQGLLAFDTNLLLEILKHDRLTVLFLTAMDGDAVIAKIPLKGALEVIARVQRKCDSAIPQKIQLEQRLDAIIQSYTEMQKEQKKIQKRAEETLERLQSEEERDR